MPDFDRIERIDGYLPIEDYGLIGDGTACALVGRDGAISWMCIPRFDADPIFCSILDRSRGGHFAITLEGLSASRQYYHEETSILVTEMRSSHGAVRVEDALAFRTDADLHDDVPAGCRELVRVVTVLHGSVRLGIEVALRDEADAERCPSGLRIRWTRRPDLDLVLTSSRELKGLSTELDLEAGDTLDLALRWGEYAHRDDTVSVRSRLHQTAQVWERWLACVSYDGPQRSMVRRSAITLKMLDHIENGAIVAAPTSSLPETIGGERNWDYRYAWIRDVAFSVFALRRIGLNSEALAFLKWILDAVERHEKPRVLFDLDGNLPDYEQEDDALEGYRRSAPVRWGNGAADQVQNDVYGEILDCAYQWSQRGGTIDEPLWAHLTSLVEDARRVWNRPGHGIWEIRSDGRLFTYSAALCHVALDRGANIAERVGLTADVRGWRTEAAKIQQAIFEQSWDEKIGAFTEHLGDGGAMDASVLTLPLRRVIPAEHPKMRSTVDVVVDRLGAGNGLIYRYHPDESPDGLEGEEGAFLLCSFWLVETMALQGHLDEAMALYDSLCARAGHLGLLPEQIDPSTGRFLGNYPQAFSHVGVIAAGVTLDRLLAGERTSQRPGRA